MFTLPKMLTRRLDRVSTRRRYADLSGALNETFTDLRTTRDRDERAVLIDFAAEVTGELAGLHTPAWGRDEDPSGRPMAVSLASAASLLRTAAASERAVIGSFAWSADWGDASDDRSAEIHVWTLLAATDDPAQRAVHLDTLCALVSERVGPTAAEVLTILAGTEAHMAGHGDRAPRTPRLGLPRLVVLAVLGLVAALVCVPGLATHERIGFGGTVLACAYAVLWLLDHRRGLAARAPAEYRRDGTSTGAPDGRRERKGQ